MGLNPSNMIAQATNPGVSVFRNLARHLHHEEIEKIKIFDEVDAVCAAELAEAGISCDGFESFRKTGNGCYNEVPTKWMGCLAGWGFRRSWYYWRADGPGIPPDRAEELHKEFGTQCRVAGHAGCPSPRDWYNGFAVGNYHIDTQAGLNALAKLIIDIYIVDSVDLRCKEQYCKCGHHRGSHFKTISKCDTLGCDCKVFSRKY